MPSDEIALLLESINRESADGKRDFAVMSLAAVSGLRAGDMASWKPDEIGWKKHEIRLVQGKTAELLAIPVLRQRRFCPGVKKVIQKLRRDSGAGSPCCANFQNICMQWDTRIT